MRPHLKHGSLAAITALGSFAFAPLSATAMIQCGMASWYDHNGTQSASGETIDAHALVAAHPSLPFGTKVHIENLGNGRETTVEVNDRGPFTHSRLIDVSRATAEELGFIDGGVARVRISTLDTSGTSHKCP